MRQFTILNADVMDGLRTLPDGSVQCCVTSQPYWGLRDYGTASWDGGDPGCDHVRPRQEQGPSGQRADRAFTGRTPFLDQCGRCGARRVDRQIGLEPTPEQYVERLVEVFREVRRVLRVDGVLWLNLGDCYHSGDRGGYCNDAHRWEKSELQAKNRGNAETIRPNRLPQAGLKDKDLVGIPWRVAFALQADGWWLRSDVIWHKPNPMPSSVTDRPTTAHEYVFLLSKSARYFYDMEAIAERAVHAGRIVSYDGTQKNTGHENRTYPGTKPRDIEVGETRNARSVWTITTKPFPEAHFATFPPELPERCIRAGSREGDTILDPFAGAGTTGLVALRLNRRFVGIELNPEYAAMAESRIIGDAPLFNKEIGVIP